MGLEDAAEASAMWGLLVRDEQVLERRDAACEQFGHMLLDDWEIFWVPGLDQNRRGLTSDQEGGVVTVVDLALMALGQAVADPEHAGRDLARHCVGHPQRSSSRET